MHHVPCHDDAELDDEGKGGFYHECRRGFHTGSVSRQGTTPKHVSHATKKQKARLDMKNRNRYMKTSLLSLFS